MTGASILQAEAEAPGLGRSLPRPSVLRARGIGKAFDGVALLKDVDIDLGLGEVVLLEGENGSGKTTLINILTGNIEPDCGTIEYRADHGHRSWTFPRSRWQTLNPFRHFAPQTVARHGIGRTWQDVRLFGSLTLRENIALADARLRERGPVDAFVGGEHLRRAEAAAVADADAVLAHLGLAGREGALGDAISLGQSQRVAIARAVAAGARILFLDEPLSGLDQAGLTSVIALLRELVERHALTLIIVEHVLNHPRLRSLVTATWRLEDGRIRLDSEDRRQRAASPARQQNQFDWIAELAGDGVTITDEPLERGARLIRIAQPSLSARPVALELRGLVVTRGPRVVVGRGADDMIAGLDLELYEGEVAILQAPNGWGKSSLLSTVAGLLPATRGTVLLHGEAITGLSAWRRARRGLRTLLSGHRGFSSLQVGEVLQLADSVATAAELPIAEGKPVSALSGGQRQMLALLGEKANGLRPCVRLLDEPLSALDAAAVRRAIALIRPGPRDTVLIAIPSIDVVPEETP